MAKSPKKIFSLAKVQYYTKNGWFVFSLADRQGRKHDFSCDPTTFADIVNQFSTCLTVASAKYDIIPRPHPLDSDINVLAIEAAHIDVGLSADSKILIRVASPNNQSFDIRLHADALPVLEKGLQKIREHLKGSKH